MALNIKNSRAEQLVAEVAKKLGVSKTEAIIVSLDEKNAKLDERIEERRRDLRRWLEEEVWPLVPPDALGKTISREEFDEIMGYGPHGHCE